MTNLKTITDIRKALRGKICKKDLPFMEQVLKTRRKVLGVKVPQLRKIAKAACKGKSLDQMVPLVKQLLYSEFFEEGCIGLYILGEYEAGIIAKESFYWDFLEEYINHIENWCHSDYSCGIRNILVQENPARISDLKTWVSSSNPWKRRAALVSLVRWSKGFKVCAPKKEVLWMTDKLLDDKEFYVQRAVGWILRDLGVQYPKEVFAYIKKNNNRLASISRSTAMEKLRKQGYTL